VELRALQKPANKEKEQNRSWWYIGVLGITLLTKYKTIVPLLAKFAIPAVSMLASVFAYAWVTRNWAIGVGLVTMILIHEIGHVLAAKKKGLPVSLPIFIPFLGAFIAMKKHPRDAVTEAYIAIGGPVIGTAGAFVFYLLGAATDNTTLLVVAYIGFFLNLINLIPIHPLDGGRIATAVTRWLWLVGLIGGIVVVWYLGSVIFFIIWAMFVWELYSKYVRKKKDNLFTLPLQLKIPAEYLRLNGLFIPGEEHQKTLAFHTFSNMEGRSQTVELFWDTLGVRDNITMQQQCLVKSVKVVRIKHLPGDGTPLTHIVAYCELVGTAHESERYYDVPVSARWTFGIAYLGLACFLGIMMFTIHAMGIPGVNG
jgi:Zn-dependent protease